MKKVNWLSRFRAVVLVSGLTIGASIFWGFFVIAVALRAIFNLDEITWVWTGAIASILVSPIFIRFTLKIVKDHDMW
jgi:DNA integrity scanning protein DisA with diadenylate cyclase activity